MESENIVEPEEILQPIEDSQVTDIHLEETPSSSIPTINWEERNKRLHFQYIQVSHNGSIYMKPEEVFRVVQVTSHVQVEKDPYVEMYYYNKIKEKEDTAQESNWPTQHRFLAYHQKEAIAKHHALRELKAKIFQNMSSSLGKPTVHNYRLPKAQLDVGIIDRDDEGSVGGTHLKVLSAIELGYSSLIKMEMLEKQLEECDNEFKKLYINLEQKKARRDHMSAFFMDVKDSGEVDVKPRWLIRVMSQRKGRKLFLRSYRYFTKDIWLQFLSYLIPYILIWCDQESSDESTELVLQMIKEYLSSEFVDLAFITSIMEMFVKQK